MKHRTLKYIWDVADSCKAIADYAKDKALNDYLADRKPRTAVERELIIIGEALFQAEKSDPELVNHIKDLHKIISFRHVLVHGYGEVKDEMVWAIVQKKLPDLYEESKRLLDREENSG